MRAVATVIVLVCVPAFVSAQAGVTAECPEDECHVAPFFRGSGGFVGRFNPKAMADGETLTSVGLVVTCGNVTATASVEPAADGTVAHLFDDANGLACHLEGGEIQIHGLMDGAWYWIHDEVNSAVSHLLPKQTLGNMQTRPFDVSGGDITMTEGTGGHATLVKDTVSGRVGILPHILPGIKRPKCGGAAHLRSDCLLTGEYTVEIRNAAGASVADTTIQRGSADITLTVTIGSEGNIVVDTEEEVRGQFAFSGPGGAVVPAVYNDVRWTNPANNMENTYSHEVVHEVRLTVPRAVDGSGAILASVNNSAGDPCRAANQQRDDPVTVVVAVGTSTNTVPGFGPTNGPTASYRISCPPAARQPVAPDDSW